MLKMPLCGPRLSMLVVSSVLASRQRFLQTLLP
jgi:hypothetical protein